MYIGVMKLLLEAWLFGSNRETKISTSQRTYLRNTLLKPANVPDDFQRKEYDLDNLSNWKATQYRFFCITPVLDVFVKCYEKMYMSILCSFLLPPVFFAVLNWHFDTQKLQDLY